MTNELDSSLDLYVKAVLGRKAMEVVLLDVRELTSIADVFLICSGRSNRQVTAIAEFVLDDLKKQGIRALSVEGLKDGHWVLLDYGDAVVHVFHRDTRSYYNLKRLWGDAPQRRYLERAGKRSPKKRSTKKKARKK